MQKWKAALKLRSASSRGVGSETSFILLVVVLYLPKAAVSVLGLKAFSCFLSEAALPSFWWSQSQSCHFSSPFQSPSQWPPWLPLGKREDGIWTLAASHWKGGHGEPKALGLAVRGTIQEAAVVGGFYFHQYQ
jgi:hypothetical protein